MRRRSRDSSVSRWITCCRAGLVEHFQKLNLPNLTVVSPDAGGVERARAFAKRLNAELAIMNNGESKQMWRRLMNVIGDVKGRTCLVVDDIIDTAAYSRQGGGSAHQRRRNKVHACCTHPVLSGPAVERIQGSELVEVVVTKPFLCTAKRVSAKRFRCSAWAITGAGRAIDSRRDVG